MEQNKDQSGTAVRGEAVALTDADILEALASVTFATPVRLPKGWVEFARAIERKIVSARAADAPSEPSEMYECIGKGGEYELLGEAYGAGPAKGTAITVYRDTTSLGLFYRSVADFGKRMRRIGTMTGAPIGKSRAADALDSQPTEAASNDAVKIAVSALKEISEWRFGWDGDCGVTAVADAALEAIEAAQASSQPTDGGVQS